MSRHPQVKWAQRLDKVYITVQLADAKDIDVKLEPEGIFTFSATAGSDGNSYELTLKLHDKVNVEESKINKGVRNIFCVLEKAEKGWWKKLLSGDEKTPHYLTVDWDKWVDEDDDNAGDAELNGMDFSNLGMGGGMGGMGGMDMSALAGMGGMGGGMGGLDMSALAGMGGMGGMSGMGGMDMSGMGGMGDDFDDSDDEVQTAEKPSEITKAEEATKTEEAGKAE